MATVTFTRLFFAPGGTRFRPGTYSNLPDDWPYPRSAKVQKEEVAMVEEEAKPAKPEKAAKIV